MADWSDRSVRQKAWAVAVFALLATLFFVLHKISDKVLEDLERERAAFETRQIAERLNRELTARLAVAEALAASARVMPAISREQFTATTDAILDALPGYQTMSLVSADGVILETVPRESNAVVIGRNIMQMERVRTLLLESRATGEPRISGVLPLFQGGEGVIAYFPIYPGGEFAGWVSAVIRFDSFVKAAFAPERDHLAALRLTMGDDREAAFEYRMARAPVAVVTSKVVDVRIMNQRLSVSTDIILQPSAYELVSHVILTAAVALCALLAFLLYRSWRVASRYERLLLKERYDGTLINLLCHDLANVAMNLKVSVASATKRLGVEAEPLLGRIATAVRTQEEILARVRDMRAYELGKKQLNLVPTKVRPLFVEAERLFGEVLRTKTITLDYQAIPDDLDVLVDSVVFQINVVNNLMSNAIKFSEDGTTITVRAWRDGDAVLIEMRDQGVGMSEVTLQNLFSERFRSSTTGTSGEPGTGLGVLQVKAYMDFFGGRVAVTSRDKKKHPGDHGTVFRLWLPRGTGDGDAPQG